MEIPFQPAKHPCGMKRHISKCFCFYRISLWASLHTYKFPNAAISSTRNKFQTFLVLQPKLGTDCRVQLKEKSKRGIKSQEDCPSTGHDRRQLLCSSLLSRTLSLQGLLLLFVFVIFHLPVFKACSMRFGKPAHPGCEPASSSAAGCLSFINSSIRDWNFLLLYLIFMLRFTKNCQQMEFQIEF